MNLRQLRTLVAFLDKGSFAAAGDEVGLSHSAVSVQMQRLEEELSGQLFDRSSRPPSLTPLGIQVSDQARTVLSGIDEIKATASGTTPRSSVSIGFVPTTLKSLLPAVLNRLREDWPTLQVNVKSRLSSELAAQVMRGELDFALLTSPIASIEELTVIAIAEEPLYVIGPSSQFGLKDDAALARSMPFISFNKKSWLGQEIATRLQSRGIYVDETMEVDSLDTIEDLVLDGFGVSIIPQRLLAPTLSDRLVKIPFCSPVQTRKLVLIRRTETGANPLDHAIEKIFQGLQTS